jgi:glycosyltransferase involved in cell wall biosynthesis
MLAILLSTFNGERYLREQLDSLISQTFRDFTLYIRDDGSNDGTIDVLLEYEKKFENFVIFNDSQKHRGACMSFMWLLEKVEAKYYMFCDQDDVWFPTKVQLTLDAIQSEECRLHNNSVLVHTDLVVTDSSLNIISQSLWDNDNTNPLRITRKYLKLVNYITGCTVMFNRKARDLSVLGISENKIILMHDFWVGICVDSSKGVIVSLPIPTIYYRQHTNNVIGASSNNIYRFPRLKRYFHIPNFKYSIDLYKMIKLKYNMNLFQYLVLRVKFYLK